MDDAPGDVPGVGWAIIGSVGGGVDDGDHAGDEVFWPAGVEREPLEGAGARGPGVRAVVLDHGDINELDTAMLGHYGQNLANGIIR